MINTYSNYKLFLRYSACSLRWHQICLNINDVLNRSNKCNTSNVITRRLKLCLDAINLDLFVEKYLGNIYEKNIESYEVNVSVLVST